MRHKYTTDQVDFIKTNTPGRTNAELTEMFNAHFDLKLSNCQIHSFKGNNGLRSGVDCRFKRGHTPANKGRKGVDGWEPTQFKKGHVPSNYKPVGTERVNGDDYVDIKVADPNKWRAKHILLWEAANGPIPKGYVVIFADKDRRNFNLDNLVLVSRKQLAVMNKRGLIQRDGELTKTGIIIADVYCRIGERKRKTQGRRSELSPEQKEDKKECQGK